MERVCVIGAGSSGIAVAKVLGEHAVPFDCFEKSDEVGGNWLYKNKNGMSSAYDSLHINTSRDRMSYADYPMQFTDFNMWASIGAFGFGLMQVYFFFFVVLPMMRGQGEKAPQKPWEGAEGLEWEVPSPAPWHTFENPPKLDASAT